MQVNRYSYRIECEPGVTKEPKLRLEIKPLIAIDSEWWKCTQHNDVVSKWKVLLLCFYLFFFCERRRRKRI